MTYFQGLPELALFVLAALSAGGMILFLHKILGAPTSPHRTFQHSLISAETSEVAFLFDGSELLDATPSARQMIEAMPVPDPSISEIGAFLERRFPGLQKRLMSASKTTQRFLTTDALGATARLERVGDSLRLTIHDNTAENLSLHPMAMAAMREELAALRHIGESAPQLIWKLDNEENVTWANAAYLALVDQLQRPEPGIKTDWPPLRLFPDLRLDPQKPVNRMSLPNPTSGKEEWYDVTITPCNGGSILFAADASGIVRADAQSKNFVQTLTKTFAELSTGLAIFDRSRRLVMFNPALLEMTQLPITFLSGQPVFGAVLDRLRDGGMLPEPKNYATWRDEVAALEAEAENGTYSEIWTMPGGETYRVTGRPHPNGALAFLIDDISVEVTRTRSFRSEREVTQAVVDVMDEAIAVFSPTGALVMTNAKYDSKWTERVADAGSDLATEFAYWQTSTVPNPVWPAIYNSVSSSSNRSTLRECIRLSDGHSVACRVAPLVGGACLVGFQLDEPSRNAPVQKPSNALMTSQAS